MKKEGFLKTYYKNLKELNVTLIVILVLLFVVVTGVSSYALFGTEIVASDTISMEVGKTKTPEMCFDVDEAGKINAYKCFDGNEFGLNTITNVVIPLTINGIRVISISDFAFESKNIESVIIPSSITKIGSYAFNHNNITELRIPSNITSLAEGAFANNKLTSVAIEGKLSNSDFNMLGENIFGWADGFGDINISYNA